jgi:uncharacterized protein (DUF2062 family)
MKTIATLVFVWLIINATALIINLLFSNPYTATITFFAFFITGAWIIRKAIKL